MAMSAAFVHLLKVRKTDPVAISAYSVNDATNQEQLFVLRLWKWCSSQTDTLAEPEARCVSYCSRMKQKGIISFARSLDHSSSSSSSS